MEAKLNLVSFKREDAEKIVKSLGLRLKEDKTLQSDGKPVTCHSCGQVIKVDNLGCILHSPLEFYCDQPECFAKYVYTHL